MFLWKHCLDHRPSASTGESLEWFQKNRLLLQLLYLHLGQFLHQLILMASLQPVENSFINTFAGVYIFWMINLCLNSFYSYRLTVHVQNDSVAVYSKMYLLPFICKDLRSFPGKSLSCSIILWNRKFNSFSPWIQSDSKLRLILTIKI